MSVYQEKTILLEPDDVIIIYTDGITEAFNTKGDMFEEARLIEAVQEVCAQGTHQIIENVKRHINEFIGSAKQSDDMAMIVAKVT